jgi:peptidoglycan/LPS O-acetylase OafA/YrhL
MSTKGCGNGESGPGGWGGGALRNFMSTVGAHPNKGHYISYLDSVRSFAILSVLAVHAGVPGFECGWLGVDLFFALSGFLITTLLLNEWRETGDVALGMFWIRRFLRLMPAYYLYIFCVTVAIWWWPESKVSVHGGWTPKEFTLSLWAYFINFAPMGGIWNGQGATLHLWSLAIEEQYYIFWPVCLFLLLRYSKHRLLISWALFTAVLIYFAVFATVQERATMLYARGFSLFLASAIAVSLHQCKFENRVPRLIQNQASNLLTLSALLTLIVFMVASLQILSEAEIRHFLLPPLVLCYVASIAGLWYGSVSGIWKFLLSRPVLIYVGKISYGIYLYHEIVRIFIWWVTGSSFRGYPRMLAYGVRLALYVTLSVIVAGASYRFLERPFLELKKRFRPRGADATTLTSRRNAAQSAR